MYTDANFDTNINSDITGGGGPMGGTTYGLKSFVQNRSSNVAGQVDCSVLSSVYEIDDSRIAVFPNPTQGKVTISWEDGEVSKLSLYNTLGVQVYQVTENGSNMVEIDLEAFGKGIYFLKLQTVDGQAQLIKRILNQ